MERYWKLRFLTICELRLPIDSKHNVNIDKISMKLLSYSCSLVGKISYQKDYRFLSWAIELQAFFQFLKMITVFHLVEISARAKIMITCQSMLFKGTLSGLRQFWQMKVLQKWWKMLFISPQKLFMFSRYLSFCLDFLAMYQNGLIKKIRLISNFMTS